VKPIHPEPRAFIRNATHADVPVLGRLGKLLVQTHYDFDNKRFIPASDRTEQGYGSFLGSQIDDKDAVVIVAEENGRVVGYSYGSNEGHDWMSLRGPAGELHDIVVDPAHRGKGIGERLLAAMVKALEEKGAPRVVLSTAYPNDTAQRLFERAGFRRTMVEMTRETT
jgi:ribosomal protein S18 acetylase RimI-like enzyme